MPLELYGTRACPYTAEMRSDLEWEGRPFVEYDVEADAEARGRLFSLVEGAVSVPVLVDEGRIVQVGWKGQGCYVTVQRS
ncbi:MAG TPA: Uxx-star family glutaredoxin-like (seleno)protein [Candidatus Cybelea sp.]|jgi:glutaredoxin 3|nr:Uxx-star family glutaredoxin-like (seleno)protein [Candidatus Cybelea sp.]